jgi:DNA (cytosine-5)-methyltransferase 1
LQCFARFVNIDAFIKGDMKKIQDYLQIKAAAELLGVTASTLRNWERAGKLVSHRHPLNRYRLYKREDLEAFLQSIHVSKSQSPREA